MSSRQQHRLAPIALACALCGACGAVAPASERPRAPATDRDPLPYAPPPAEVALAGELSAVWAAGGEDQARAMLPALVDALRAPEQASERALAALFHDEVGLVNDPRAEMTWPRTTVVLRLSSNARRGVVPADTPVSELFDLEGIVVSRAAQFFANGALPSTVMPTDLVVAAPILGPGRAAMGALFGWRGRAHLTVRPGREPRIVAY
ncbi:MAG: hypothetical protein KF729_14930 [Sandaracinaceae bacterium]|nr:hypothetical protein [Sandaracinaceae bacterium]